MHGHPRLHRRLARLIAGAGLLAAIGAGAATGFAGSAGAVQLVGYGGSLLHGHSAPGAPAPGASPSTTYTFAISGKVSGLYPGKTLPLHLTVTNRNKFSIRVTSINTTVSNASTTCVAANLKVTAFAGKLSVGAGKTGAVTVHATLLHAAPNACKGKLFPLRYHGTATGG